MANLWTYPLSSTLKNASEIRLSVNAVGQDTSYDTVALTKVGSRARYSFYSSANYYGNLVFRRSDDGNSIVLEFNQCVGIPINEYVVNTIYYR